MMKPLKPMIWKELRENAQWAMLAMITVALLFGFQVADLRFYYDSPTWFFSHPIFPPQTIVYAPLVGLMLGFLQIAPELRRDQWAFLMHRPASRAAMFWGKVIPGVILYTLALGIPLLGVGCWVFTHSNIIVPFSWRMVAPNLADMLLGLQFYFAAILIAVRPAHWYGSKTIAIAAAVLGSGFICLLGSSQLHKFWQEALISSLMLAIFVVAAQSCFETFGQYRQQGRLGRLALGTVFLASLFTLGGVGVLASIVGINQLAFSASPATVYNSLRIARPTTYTYYRIDSTGHILRVTEKNNYLYSPNAPGQTEGVITQITTLDGATMPTHQKGKGLESPPKLEMFRLSKEYSGLSVTFRPRQGYRELSDNFAQVADLTANQLNQGSDFWFYSDYERRFIRYSAIEKKRLGYLGPGGFYTPDASLPSSQARFAGPLYGVDSVPAPLARCGDTYYWINVYGKTVTPVTFDRPGHRIRDLVVATTKLQSFDYEQSVFVLTDTAIEAFNSEGKLIFSTPLEHMTADYPSLSIGVTALNQHVFLYAAPLQTTMENGFMVHHPVTLPTYITELTNTGQVLHRYTLPSLTRPYIPDPIPAPRPSCAPYIAGVTVPLIGTLAAAHFMPYSLYYALDFTAANYDSASLAHAQKAAGLLLWLGLASSILCTILAFFVAHRCAFTTPGYASWMLGVFLLGPVGLLLMLALNEWPARVTCASCGQRRDVHREFCEHCAAPFPPPIPDGTEIFEPIGAFAT